MSHLESGPGPGVQIVSRFTIRAKIRRTNVSHFRVRARVRRKNCVAFKVRAKDRRTN